MSVERHLQIRIIFLILYIFGVPNFVLAQVNAGFAGKWKFDKTASKLDERVLNSLETITKNVIQQGKKLIIETYTKSNTEVDPVIANIFNLSKNSKSTVYREKFYLDGKKRTKITKSRLLSPFPVKQKSSIKSENKLEFTQIFILSAANREQIITITEVWELVDSKTLRIEQKMENSLIPEEGETMILVFVKY